MSSYVESVLANGEQIVYRATISHWKFFLSYVIGVFLLFSAGVVLIVTQNYTRSSLGMAAIPLMIGLLLILSVIIRRQTTELVLTDRRVITKRGVISRDTVEMNLNKVESVHVSQSLLGRLLGYGDVTVMGTGASLEPLRGIAKPLELRKKLGEVVRVTTGNP